MPSWEAPAGGSGAPAPWGWPVRALEWPYAAGILMPWDRHIRRDRHRGPARGRGPLQVRRHSGPVHPGRRPLWRASHSGKQLRRPPSRARPGRRRRPVGRGNSDVSPILRSYEQGSYTPHAQAGGGRIVNLFASSVKQPIENLVLSAATRLGALGFAKTLADEVARDNIRVNNVAPGFLQTERMMEVIAHRGQAAGVTAEEAMQALVRSIPMGRIGRPWRGGSQPVAGTGSEHGQDRTPEGRVWRRPELLGSDRQPARAATGHA